MIMAAQIPSGATNQLAGGCNSAINNGKINDDVIEKPEGEAARPRRRPSARRGTARSSVGPGAALCNSLRADRRGGLESTGGRLTVSFSDPKGLSKAQLGDILSAFSDDEDEPDKEKRKGGGPGDGPKKKVTIAAAPASAPDLNLLSRPARPRTDVGGANATWSAGSDALVSAPGSRRPGNLRSKLTTIQSRRSLTFGTDDAELDESSEDEEEE
jgi:hypothetical protein